jgi:hypothetical protein
MQKLQLQAKSGADSSVARRVHLCLSDHAPGPSQAEPPDFRVGCTAALNVDGAVLSSYCLLGGSGHCFGLQWSSYPSENGHMWTVNVAEQLGVSPLL